MLKNNTVLKILSLLLAIALWAFVIGEVNPSVKKTIHSIPVEFINTELLEESSLEIDDKGEYRVDIVVEGTRSDMGRLEVSDIKAQADMANATKGENKVYVHVTVPSGITLKEVKTSEITVNIIDLIITKEVPVTVKITGEPAGEPEIIIPKTIAISGPAAILETIDAVTADAIDLSTVKEDTIFELELTLPEGVETAKESKDIGVEIKY